MADDVEVTLEANPGTVECGDPRGYRSAGVNRLSLGAQSFDDASLEALGRIHGVDDIGRSFAAARQAGFDNINLDLMYALPGQEVAAAIRDIEAAARLGPEHLSWYQLTLEPNTVFYARPPDGLPDEEAAYRMQRDGEALLAGSGYGQYEVSAYARDGRRCVHNLNYWRFGDYAAVGAGAHGKLTTAEGVFRYSKPANARQYMQATAAGHDIPTTRIGEQDLVFEFMLNALRLVEGFDQGLFSATTGLPQGLLEERLVPLVKRGLIAQSGTRSWCPTATGSRFLNDLQAHFLP